MSNPDDDTKWQAEDQISRSFIHDPEFTTLVENTRPVDEIDVDRYDAIIVAGGQAPMYNFDTASNLHHKFVEFYERGKLAAALCHGTAILRYATLSNGDVLVTGKTVTGFPNVEEDFAENAVWDMGALPRGTPLSGSSRNRTRPSHGVRSSSCRSPGRPRSPPRRQPTVPDREAHPTGAAGTTDPAPEQCPRHLRLRLCRRLQTLCADHCRSEQPMSADRARRSAQAHTAPARHRADHRGRHRIRRSHRAGFVVGDFGRALMFARRASDGLRRDGRVALLAQTLVLESFSALYLGRWDVMQVASSEALRFAEETDQPHGP
jgi:hypothetical protein